MGDRTILDALMEGDLSVLDGLKMPEAPLPAPGALGYVQQFGSSLLQGAAGQTGEMLRGAGTLLGAVPGVDGGPAFPQAAYDVNEALPATMEESAKAIIPDVPGVRESDVKVLGIPASFLADTLPRAMGSITPYLAGGGVASLARLPPALAAAASGALASGSAGFYEAKYSGADEATQWKSYWLNAMAGTSNAVEVARIFSRIDKASGGMLRRLLVDAPIGGVIEGAQEAGTQGASNLIAKHLYDPERELLSGVAEGGGAGFLTAVILEAVTPGRANKQPKPDSTAQEPIPSSEPAPDQTPINQSVPGMPEPAPQGSFEAQGALKGEAPILSEQPGPTAPVSPGMSGGEASGRVALPTAEGQNTDAPSGPALTPSLEVSAPRAEAPPAPAASFPEDAAGVSRPSAPAAPRIEQPTAATERVSGAEPTPRGIKHADTLAERGTERVARESKADTDLHARAKAKLDEDPFAGQKLVNDLESENRPHTDEEGTLLGLELTRLANERDAAQEAFKKNPTLEAKKRIAEVKAAYARASTVSDLSGSETGAGLRNRRLRFNRDYSLAQMEREIEVAKDGESLTKSESDRIEALHDRMAKAEAGLSAIEIRQGEIELERQLTRIENEARRSVRKTSRTQRVAEIDREIDALVRGIGRKLQTTTGANLGNVAAVVPDIAKVAKLFIEKGSLKFQDFHDAMTKALGDNVRPHLAAAWDQARTEHRDELLGPAVTKMRKGESARADLEGIARTFMERGVSRPSVVDQVHRAVAEIAPDITREQVVEALQERRLKAFKTRQATGAKESKAAARDQDFGPRTPEELKLDEEALTLKTEREKARREFEREKMTFEREHRTKAEKIRDQAMESLNLPKAVWSSGDVSAVGRQALFFTAQDALFRQRSLARRLRAMFKAFANDDFSTRMEVSMQEDPSYQLLKRNGVQFSDSLNAKEELYQSRLADKYPWVKHSNRAFSTFLNLTRLEHGKRMLAASDGSPTNIKAIAGMVNLGTGRGNIGNGRFKRFVEGSGAVLWAPSLYISRFQLLLGQPLLGRHGSLKQRALFAKEYATTLAGLASFYALAAMYREMNPDDPEKPEFTTDPTNSDAGKVVMGNTRVDPLGGLAQTSRLLSREVKIVKQAVTPGEEVKEDAAGIALQFLRTKISPSIGIPYALVTGRDIAFNRKVDRAEVATEATLPLTFWSIKDAMEDLGVEKGVVLGILSLFGAGLDTRKNPKPAPEARK